MTRMVSEEHSSPSFYLLKMYHMQYREVKKAAVKKGLKKFHTRAGDRFPLKNQAPGPEAPTAGG